MRNGEQAKFDLAGYVDATSVESAAETAIAIAKQAHSEINQVDEVRRHRAVINMEEIQEFDDCPTSQIGLVDVEWAPDNSL